MQRCRPAHKSVHWLTERPVPTSILQTGRQHQLPAHPQWLVEHLKCGEWGQPLFEVLHS